MAFDLVVGGWAPRTLYEALGDLVGAESIRREDDTLVLAIEDQSALVAVLTRLNDLGVRIDRVHQVP